MSISKGLKSLEKHVSRKDDKSRWGFFVQKEWSDFSCDLLRNVRIETIYGAAFVYASKTDLPWTLFDYKVMPPHLPFGAFRHAHMWGPPLRQWAVMSAHRQLCENLEREGQNLAQLQSPEFQRAFLSYDITAVVPSQNERGVVQMRRAHANKHVAKLSRKISHVFDLLAALSGDDYTAIVEELSHEGGRLRELTEDCEGLLFDRDGGEVGWCTGPTFLDDPIVAAAESNIDAATALVELRTGGGNAESNVENEQGDFDDDGIGLDDDGGGRSSADGNGDSSSDEDLGTKKRKHRAQVLDSPTTSESENESEGTEAGSRSEETTNSGLVSSSHTKAVIGSDVKNGDGGGVGSDDNNGNGGGGGVDSDINNGEAGGVDSDINDDDGGGVDSGVNDGNGGGVDSEIIDTDGGSTETPKRKRPYVIRNFANEAERRAHKNAYDMVLDRKQRKADAQRERRARAKQMKAPSWPPLLGVLSGKEAADLSLPEPPTEKEAVDLSLPELLQEMLLYGLTEYATKKNGQPYDPPRHVEGFGKTVCHHIKSGNPLPAFIRDEIMTDLRKAKLNQ